ncbi:MAG: hypothetical protein GOV15_00745, partial [Candidatus Diapherotrites archaeon]|nr:hypothetical protein [Candidatus Diapherotrites archaeon]
IQHRLSQQVVAEKKFELKRDLDKTRGDFVYANFVEVSEVLQAFKSNGSKSDFEELKAELKLKGNSLADHLVSFNKKSGIVSLSVEE